MTVPVTAALAGLFLLLALLFGWRGARAARPHTEPRLVPWRFLMLLAFTGMVAMLVHLVNLIRDAGVVAP
jgi:hypothetical protein